MLQLFKHQLKEQVRSSIWQKSLALRIFFGFVALYLLLNFIVLGLIADKIVIQLYGDVDVVSVLTGFLLYYFVADLLFRFLFQQVPSIAIQPYLTLAIKKSTLLHYPILKSAFSFFNVIPLFVFAPFFVKNIFGVHNNEFTIIWGGSVLSLIVINNNLNFFLKKYFAKKPLLIMLLFVLLAVLLYLNYINKFGFNEYFTLGLYAMGKSYFFLFVPLVLVVLSYFLAYFMLKRNAYIEDIGKIGMHKMSGFSFLNRYGELGQLMRMELKLVLRNKRPRTILYVSIMFLFYGLLFYPNEIYSDSFFLSFCALFVTSSFAINHGQFLFGMESSYFDMFLAHKVSVYNFIKSKYIVLSGACIMSYVLTLPYGFLGLHILYLQTAFVLYNIGVTTILMIYFGTYSTSFIDLGKSQFMNYQGTGIAQFALMLPVFGLPLIIYYSCIFLGISAYYNLIIGIVGVFGMLLHDQLLQLMVKQFEKRKYRMAVGFRKN